MQNFKNFIIRTMAVAAVLALPALPGCGDKDAGEGPAESTFKVPEQPIIKNNYASQNNTITVVASGDVAWTAAKDDTEAAWLTITSASGKGNGNVIFNLAEKESPGMRSTTVTITGNSDSTGKEFSGTVTVQQMGTDPTIVMEPFGAASISSEANSAYSIAVTSNVVWSASLTVISGGDGWVSKVSPAANTEGSGTVVLSFLENTGEESRQVKLTVVSADDPSVKAELTITQQKPGVRYTIVFEGMTSLLGEMSSTTLTYAPAAGGTAATLGDVDVEVDMTEKRTTVFYADVIPDGAYELKTVGATGVNALFTLAGGIVTYVERWDAPLGQFGGETEARPLKISTAAHLQALAASVNGGTNYSGLYLLQTENIALSGNFTPIGVSTAKFSGIYDGAGKEVSKLKVNLNTAGAGLFGYVAGVAGEGENPAVIAVVKNLTVRGAGIAVPDDTATSEAYDIIGNKGYAGGIAGDMAANSLISNCVNYANVFGTIDGAEANGSVNLGGIVGTTNGANIENCTNYGKIRSLNQGSYLMNNIGGIVGNTSNTVAVTSCYNRGQVSVEGNAGGVVGNTSAATTLSKCGNYGTVTIVAGSGRTGGIAGSFAGTADQCFNVGSVGTGGNNVGGISGYLNGTLTNCYNSGTITFTGVNSGVLAGHKQAVGVLTNCYNCGQAAGTGTGGAIYGNAGNSANITGCYYETGKGSAAGPDVTGITSLDEAGMKTATPFAGWDTAIWKFESGKYPSLINNPEQPL